MSKSLPSNDNFVLYYHTGIYHLFSGRVIGYIDNQQFAALMSNPQLLARKLSTMPPLGFYDIIDPKAVKLRLAFLAKDPKNHRHLILSGVIKEIESSLSYGYGEVTYVDERNNMFCLETEVK